MIIVALNLKLQMIRPDLSDYSDVDITGAGNDDNAKRINERNKGVLFKNWAPFINCISSINIIQIDNAE